MLRYELERDVINGNIDIDDLEIEWNKRFKEYFGIEVDCAKNGILQDVHWADGLIGYFPTYVLGSSYACQLYHHMSKDLNMDDVLQQNTTKEINKWLKEHIHQYGASMYTKDILHKACGENFNPNYYIDYLNTIFSDPNTDIELLSEIINDSMEKCHSYLNSDNGRERSI